MSPTIHVVGASGRSGLALCRRLLAANLPVVPVVRSAARWRSGEVSLAPRLADLTDAAALRAALADAARIVCCAHARHAAAVQKDDAGRGWRAKGFEIQIRSGID